MTYEYTLEDAREAFLTMLADGEFIEEPDADDGTDCTRYLINTGWWNFAELCRALGIKDPGYMETWKHTVDRAIVEPKKETYVPLASFTMSAPIKDVRDEPKTGRKQ